MADSDGVNAWIAIDDMPISTGGGFALSIGSHVAPWRHEAYGESTSTSGALLASSNFLSFLLLLLELSFCSTNTSCLMVCTKNDFKRADRIQYDNAGGGI